MKRFCLLICLVLLAGCEVVLFGGPTPVPVLRVRSLSYETNFSANGRPIICDNKVTQLAYSFRYEGSLERWGSYLEGQTLGRVDGETVFTPGSAGVSPYETDGYQVTYTIPPNVAPYAAPENSDVSPQAIVPVPVPNPTQIGTTRLHLILEGASGRTQPYTQDIPVIVNCP